MPVRTSRGKRGVCVYKRADRAVATAVVLAVAIVLLLTGFCGSSVDMRLPGPAGWLYIGVIIVLAAFVLVWLFCGKPKGKSRTARKSIDPSRNESNT
jgi:hypothetical protein